MPKEIAGGSIIDVLGGPRPNPREHNLGASKAGPAQKITGQSKKVTGVRFSDVSSNIDSRPSKGRSSGNTFKAMPGAK